MHFLYILSLIIPEGSSILFEVYCLNFSVCSLDSIFISLETLLCESISLSVSESLLLIPSMSPSQVTLAHQHLNIFKILLCYMQSENQIKQKLLKTIKNIFSLPSFPMIKLFSFHHRRFLEKVFYES